MVQQTIEDLETVSLKNERLVLVSDQESSIVVVMKEIQKSWECEYGTAMDNSRVRDCSRVRSAALNEWREH